MKRRNSLLHAALAALVFTALAVVPALAAPPRKLLAAGVTTLTGTAIVIAQDRKGVASSRILAVRVESGKLVHVLVTDVSQLSGIHTGMDIEVGGTWQVSGLSAGETPGGSTQKIVTAARFLATSIRASGAAFAAPKATRPANGGGVTAAAVSLSSNSLIASDVSTIVIPTAPPDVAVNAMDEGGGNCPGVGSPPASIADIKRAVFAESNPTGRTVGSTFNQCSYGKTKLTALNSRVANLVRLPCNGTSSGGVPWSFSTCSFDDLNGWADAADRAVRGKGTPLDKYPHKVYLLPPGSCDMVGLGYVGCAGSYDCRAWIGAEYWNQPQAMIHELGHNLFMGHAAVVQDDGLVDEYGDGSCTMGFCCDDRCFNTPHAWQMGWIAVQQLDGSSLRAGQTVTATLASQATTARSGLRIVPSWAAGVDPIFVGYRTRAGGDDGLWEDYAGKVHVHSAAITNTYDASLTQWNAALTASNDSWAHPTAGVVVRIKSFPKGTAVVTICRQGGAETAASCAANLDNDCNGLAGPKDPACALLVRRAARAG